MVKHGGRRILLGVRACAAALAVLAAGCASDSFMLDDAAPNPESAAPQFECHVVTGFGSAEEAANGFIIHSGGIVAARKYGETGFTAEFFIRIASGNAARVRIRSEDMGTYVLPGICLTYGKDSCFVDAPGMPRTHVSERAGDDWQRVKLFSYGNAVAITLGGDVVYAVKTHLFSTDYIVFESVGGSTIDVAKLQSQGLE